MPQQAQAQQTCAEAGILLAIAAINRAQFQNKSLTTSTFNIPRTTLRDQHAGITTRRDYELNSKKLSKLEEEVIIRHILDLYLRGFTPTLGTIRDIADKLLAERGAGKVSKLWPYNFVTRFNQAYDR
jgi:hypothetical protein